MLRGVTPLLPFSDVAKHQLRDFPQMGFSDFGNSPLADKDCLTRSKKSG